MASDLELQSTQALALASDFVYQDSVPDLLFTPLPPFKPTPKSSTLVTKNRELAQVWKRLHLNSHSLDMSIDMRLFDHGRTIVTVPTLPDRKPTPLSMILKASHKGQILRKQSEAGPWLHHKVPSTFVHYLLKKQLRKSQERGTGPSQKQVRRVKELPPLSEAAKYMPRTGLIRSKSVFH